MSTDGTPAGPDWLSHDPKGQVAWVRIAQYRVAAAVVLPLLILLVPSLGDQRLSALCIICSVALISNVSLLVFARRGGVLGLPIAVLDVVLTLLFVGLVPGAYVPGLLLMLGLSSLFVFWIGRHLTIAVTACASLGFLLIGLAERPEVWGVALTMYLFTSMVMIATTSNIADAVTRAHTRYDALVNGIDAVVWEADGLVGDPEYISKQVDEVLGLPMESCATTGFLASRVHPDDVDSYVESRREISAGHSSEVEYRIRDLSGEIRYLHERVTVSVGPDGHCSRRGVVVDETARAIAEASLRGYDDFIAGAPTAMAILRLDDLDDPQSLRVVSGNPAAAELLVTTVDQAVGMRLSEVMPGIPIFMSRLANVVILNTSLEAPFIKLPGSDSVYSLRAIPLPDQCIGLTMDDVTSAARTAETLKHQALHDHLTGLPNRAQFNDRLDHALRDRRHEDGSTNVAVLMIDLNKFKDVNDRLGHEYGDNLLVELARRLGRNIRGCDTIARLGGDEFAMIVLGSDPDKTAMEVAERIEQLVSEPFLIDGHELSIGASIGVAVRSSSGTSARELVRNADSAMYRAKDLGGGTVVHAFERRSDSPQPGLRADLARALSNHEFEVLYQPRVDLTTMAPIGVEALVRWRHPRRGLLKPEQFLDITVTQGMTETLTRLVLEQALSDLERLERLGLEMARVRGGLSLNVSSANLSDPMFVTMLEEILDRSGVPPERLRLDFPENHIARDTARTLAALHSLKLAGFHLTLDNFGLGTSSVPLLNDLPIDEIKIDRSIVDGIDNGGDTVIRAIVQLGHELGLSVTANGVESSRVAKYLRIAGCDSAQGFHFGIPMGLDALSRHLTSPDMAVSGSESPTGVSRSTRGASNEDGRTSAL